MGAAIEAGASGTAAAGSDTTPPAAPSAGGEGGASSGMTGGASPGGEAAVDTESIIVLDLSDLSGFYFRLAIGRYLRIQTSADDNENSAGGS